MHSWPVVEEPFSKWGAQVNVKRTMGNFFIKRFTLTMDPILIALLTYSKIINVKVGCQAPRKKVKGPRFLRTPPVPPPCYWPHN